MACFHHNAKWMGPPWAWSLAHPRSSTLQRERSLFSAYRPRRKWSLRVRVDRKLTDGGSEAGERQRIQAGEVSNCVIRRYGWCTGTFEGARLFLEARGRTRP